MFHTLDHNEAWSNKAITSKLWYAIAIVAAI